MASPSPQDNSTAPSRHHADDCCGQNNVSRRQFIQRTGISAAAVGISQTSVMAGPFDENDYLAVIPQDKRLSSAWVKSLYARGDKDTYTDPSALRHIGMPVGGLFAGTVYLGGDGRLWLWDIFNRDQEGIAPRPLKKPVPNPSEGAPLLRVMTRAGQNYLEPVEPYSPFTQTFTLRVGDQLKTLDADGFANVTFDGRYPIGRVTYRDADCPLTVRLEAFSPFIPLQADDSSLPATVMSFTVENTGNKAVEFELQGALQNPVCLQTHDGASGTLRNHIVRSEQLTALVCSAEFNNQPDDSPREDVVFDDFEKPTYDGWTAEGNSFGKGPIAKTEIPDYQGDVGGEGQRVVNSHSTAPGESVTEKDNHLGTLTSSTFRIERHFIQFYLGGGSHKDQTCVNLLIDGQVVDTLTGRNDNHMQRVAFNVRELEGRQAQLQIVDGRAGSWGNVGVDHIVFTDRPQIEARLEQHRDFGTMTLALLEPRGDDLASPSGDTAQTADATAELGTKLTGKIGRRVTLAPGQTATLDFVITWHFPNLTIRGMPGRTVGNYYAARFPSALAVANYLAVNFDRLADTTRRWVETWYDSTLPYWLLDRTMANTSTLATTTCYRFADGRFWAWEGIGCCAGTCTHVWHYAQAMGRLFPEIERDQRQRVDFGMALSPDGTVGHRAYLNHAAGPADDGHCGRILGVYREHQMSADDGFLKRIWPQVKRAIQWLIARDANSDGMIEGAQHNTLDAAWYGKISWLASLYIATLRAGAVMATEMGDQAFARRCFEIADRGAQSILETYNGEYFIQIEDPAHKDHIGTGNGCHIDQVFGQTWAHWVGLPALFDREKQLNALRSLWKYNFVPDVGPFRAKFTRGRWYAMPGDAGLLMCTWPKGDQNAASRDHWQYGYFNECMSGFEWQAAAHMIWEGADQPDLLEKGLAIGRAIHDRYNAQLRNPYNEIECSDHYARAMASYGVFQAVCGFHHHGPNGELEFAPRLSPADFKSAFVTSEGWGSYSQKVDGAELLVTLKVAFGRVRLKTLTLALSPAFPIASSVTMKGGQVLKFERKGPRLHIVFDEAMVIEAGESVSLRVV